MKGLRLHPEENRDFFFLQEHLEFFSALVFILEGCVPGAVPALEAALQKQSCLWLCFCLGQPEETIVQRGPSAACHHLVEAISLLDVLARASEWSCFQTQITENNLRCVFSIVDFFNGSFCQENTRVWLDVVSCCRKGRDGASSWEGIWSNDVFQWSRQNSKSEHLLRRMARATTPAAQALWAVLYMLHLLSPT